MASARADGTAQQPSLGDYIEFRLGAGSHAQLRNWLTRTWGAPSFSEFWLYFNPVYGYILAYWVYRPLRRALPRALAAWLTFIASGFFLHDLVGWIVGRRARYPEMTVYFGLLGLVAVVGRAVGMNMRRLPFLVRVAVHVLYLVGCFLVLQILH
jgi:hypothetical protein